jgi:hypothetical protein
MLERTLLPLCSTVNLCARHIFSVLFFFFFEPGVNTWSSIQKPTAFIHIIIGGTAKR